MATKKPDAAQRCDVRVLAAVTIGDVRYQPDDVIEGLPEDLAKAYKSSLDQHPDAVAYARSIDAPVKPFAEGMRHGQD